MARPLVDSNITGVAGEFYVAAEISKRGGIATLTIKNTPSIDLIVTNPRNGKSANIQVKTRSVNNQQGWKLTKKVGTKSTIKNHFYVFVNLKKDELPDYYIIPFNEFAVFINKKHQRWLKATDRKGKQHEDNDIRNFKPDKVNLPLYKADARLGKKYKDNWDILGIF
ncbi:MAG TPA: aspartate-ammonia lyase [Candidatus Paceibacterota bacterium]